VRVKICGLTRLEDALAAADLGAWAAGFVFWPQSPRSISPEAARRIVEQLPAAVTPVGVFVDQDREYVEQVIVTVGLGAVQLHGRESRAEARALSRPVIKAIPVTAAGPALPVDGWGEALLLLDAHDPVRRGGTGRTIDWAAAARLARRHRTVLAGGLSPENVFDAVTCVQPYAIDVSSGVESSPGVKDHGRMRALFAAVAGMQPCERGNE
jgi:phosphoribosylanthranilate isomerase